MLSQQRKAVAEPAGSGSLQHQMSWCSICTVPCCHGERTSLSSAYKRGRQSCLFASLPKTSHPKKIIFGTDTNLGRWSGAPCPFQSSQSLVFAHDDAKVGEGNELLPQGGFPRLLHHRMALAGRVPGSSHGIVTGLQIKEVV